VGSMTGLFYALTLGGLAIGAPLLGLLVDATSVRAALAISGAVMILVALWRAIMLRRRLRAEPAVSTEAERRGYRGGIVQ